MAWAVSPCARSSWLPRLLVVREVYHRQLDRLVEDLADLAGLVAEAMSKATAALLRVDLTLAERVIEQDLLVDQRRAEAEETAVRLLALHAPVATDLRSVVTAIHSAVDLERMRPRAARREDSPASPPTARAARPDPALLR